MESPCTIALRAEIIRLRGVLGHIPFAVQVNEEPPHNTNSVYCWCAPRMNGNMVIHWSLQQIVENAMHTVEQSGTVSETNA